MRSYAGTVEKGAGRASALGFPTINIQLPDRSVSGIYAACVLTEGRLYEGVAYADRKRGLLEAHLFDFGKNLYGKEVIVELHLKIREERTFENDAELRAAIEADVSLARKHFLNLTD